MESKWNTVPWKWFQITEASEKVVKTFGGLPNVAPRRSQVWARWDLCLWEKKARWAQCLFWDRWVGQERHIPVLSGNETPLGHAAVISAQEDYLKWQWSESCIRRLSSLAHSVLWPTHSGSPTGAFLYHVYSSSGTWAIISPTKILTGPDPA